MAIFTYYLSSVACHRTSGARIKANSFLLSLISPVLHKMLCGQFVEGDRRRVTFPDIDERNFADVVDLWCGAESLDELSVAAMLQLGNTADRFLMTEVASALEEKVIDQMRLKECGLILGCSSGPWLDRAQATARRLATDWLQEAEAAGCLDGLDEGALESLRRDEIEIGAGSEPRETSAAMQDGLEVAGSGDPQEAPAQYSFIFRRMLRTRWPAHPLRPSTARFSVAVTGERGRG